MTKSLSRIIVGVAALSALVLSASLSVRGEPNRSPGPIQLADGSPLLGVYYFTHWWEPWRSSDEKILADFRLLRSMGYNTVFLDHEWSQMIDGDWAIIDRSHKLAKRVGVKILPWLSPKVWVDIGSGGPGRTELLSKMYGVDPQIGIGPDGKPNRSKPYDPAVIEAGVRYNSDYLRRYAEGGALLHVMWNGKARPVIAPTVELEWEGSCDGVTAQMLRLWLQGKYGTIDRLNRQWKTRLAGFEAIDPCDKAVFDVDAHIEGRAKYPAAVEDHVEFRARVIDNSLAEIKRRLLKEFPDLVFATELPYQIAAEHPHAIGYRIKGGANPTSASHADILMIRATDSLTGSEAKALRDHAKRTKQKIILTYRTYPEWGKMLLDGKRTNSDMGRLYAKQAAKLAHGFGFYSWNEMVDTHIVPDPDPAFHPTSRITPDESEAVIKALEEMSVEYRRSF